MKIKIKTNKFDQNRDQCPFTCNYLLWKDPIIILQNRTEDLFNDQSMKVSFFIRLAYTLNILCYATKTVTQPVA